MRLPPHNQRRINARLAERGLSKTWYHIVLERQAAGDTYDDIAELFAAEYGVRITGAAIGQWMSRARREQARVSAAA